MNDLLQMLDSSTYVVILLFYTCSIGIGILKGRHNVYERDMKQYWIREQQSKTEKILFKLKNKNKRQVAS